MDTVGSGEFRYRVNADWEKVPAGIDHPDVCSVAVDSRDRVFLLTRNSPFVLIYEPSGQFVSAWDTQFVAPHHISIGHDDSVLICDYKNHTVHKFTLDGEPTMTLGTPGVKTETGAVGRNLFSVRRSGRPFNEPTKAIIGPDERVYVTDGYFNARVHRFSPSGELELSWGEPGGGAGEFYTPHALAFGPDERIWVADRENDRIQVFITDGDYCKEFGQMIKPEDLAFDKAGMLYVMEGGHFIGRYPWLPPLSPETPPPRISIYTQGGELVSRWGTAEYREPGSFLGGHGIAVDSSGDIYSAEVNKTSQRTGEVIAGPGIRTVQKFERLP